MLQPALFLDRDGVINLDHGYVYLPSEFDFVDGIFELCLRAKLKRYLIIVVTNQAGIARGIYTEADFAVLTRWMCSQFLDKGVSIDGVYYSPYHPKHGIGRYKRLTLCRKPMPGMLLQASRIHSIDLAKSILVGDRITDIEAGRAAGIEHLYLYNSHMIPCVDDPRVTIIDKLGSVIFP